MTSTTSTPEVPFCAPARVATVVVPARGSVLGRMHENADSALVKSGPGGEIPEHYGAPQTGVVMRPVFAHNEPVLDPRSAALHPVRVAYTIQLST